MPIQIDLGTSTPRKVEAQGRIVGIDLGTTNSLVAIVRGGRPEVLKDEMGEALLPSVLEISETGQVASVGSKAKKLRAQRPEDVLFSVKRLMGRTLKDIPEEARRQIPYELVDDAGAGQVRVRVGSKTLSPIEISAEILKALTARAEKALGEKVDRAVVTVPAYFDDAQRTATKMAGRLAGLEVLRVFNEPTAAALGYGWSFEKPGTVAVFDLGGGTFDVSILRIDSSVLEVLSTAGDTQLGGDDFDAKLADFAWSELEHQGFAPESLPAEKKLHLRAEIFTVAEEAKIALGTQDSTILKVSAENLGRAAEVTITRAQAEGLWAPLVERALEKCRAALADARLQVNELDDIVLVGGSTRVPFVQRRVGEFFARKPNTSLHPDEAVALGAAVQADTLSGNDSNRLLLDVIPLSLGIETVGGAVAKLIHRNSTIPTEARDVYTNHAEKQTAFDIHVLQGERELVKDCRSLGRFKLRGLEPAPPGFHRIEVVFRIDASGILSVRAKDLRSGKAHEIEVRPTFGITDEEIFTLLEQADAHTESDAHARELVDARVEAEGVVRATEKTLANASHLATPEEVAEIRARLVDLKNAVQGASPAAIRKALAELDSVSRELAELQVNEALGEALKGTKA